MSNANTSQTRTGIAFTEVIVGMAEAESQRTDHIKEYQAYLPLFQDGYSLDRTFYKGAIAERAIELLPPLPEPLKFAMPVDTSGSPTRRPRPTEKSSPLTPTKSPLPALEAEDNPQDDQPSTGLGTVGATNSPDIHKTLPPLPPLLATESLEQIPSPRSTKTPDQSLSPLIKQTPNRSPSLSRAQSANQSPSIPFPQFLDQTPSQPSTPKSGISTPSPPTPTLREQLGLPPSEFIPPNTVVSHPHHPLIWHHKNIRCNIHTAVCPLCSTPCCAYTAASLQQSSADSGEDDLLEAERVLGLIEERQPIGMESQTFVLCTTCRRHVCAGCSGRCPEEICRDVQCVECKPEPWEICDWHRED